MQTLYKVIVFTNYSATKKIINQINITFFLLNRLNRYLVNIFIYLLQYNFKVFYILGIQNFVPNALLQFNAIDNGKKSFIKLLILNNIWFIYIKAYINNAIRAKFVEKYTANNKYAKIIEI